MKPVVSRTFGQELCNVLGIDASNVKTIKIDVEAGYHPLVHVDIYLDEQAGKDLITLLSTYKLERKND